MSRARTRLWLMGLALAGGCATAPTRPPTETPRPAVTPKARLKLAVLPVEGDVFPRLAQEINDKLGKVQLSAVDDYFVSRATLEVVQLSIECVELTTACFSSVGKSLAAQRLLFAQLQGGAKRRDKSVKVVFTLFDVPSGQVARTAEKQFKNEDEAQHGFVELLDSVVSGKDAP